MADGAPSKPDVFLSYAREDEARARQLAGALGRHGFAVFWDQETPPGQTWHSYIGEALAGARCVVVAWSRHSVASTHVFEEASEGRDRKVLVPVLFETVPPPFGFRAIHAANLTDWRPGRPSPGFDALLGAVQRIVAGQAGSGAGIEAESAAPTQRAPAKPVPETKPSVAPPTPSPASIEPLAAPPRQVTGWSDWTVVAMIAGLAALAGAGGIAVLWWPTQPGPAGPTTAPPAPGPSIAEPKPSEPSVETLPAPAPERTSAVSTGTGWAREAMRDCPGCPEMVLVPAGEFTMGSPPSEPGRTDDEGPQRKVTIAEPFWVGKYEVTFAEWDACVAAGGCSHEPRDNGWGRDSRPVIDVSWNDAKEYIGWLSRRTGKTYQLLSEAEWEYAARAGSTTVFWWGQDVGKSNANCHGCGSEWDNIRTAPVGSFRANDFGLHTTAGNVWEWVEDCWHDSYDGAPTDGSPWVGGDCSLRVLRGGSWNFPPGFLRSAYRHRYLPSYRNYFYGFRVARTTD